MSDQPPDRPLFDLLGDLPAFLARRDEIGIEALMDDVKAEIRLAMDEDGVRVVLYYGERMQDLNALMGEWAV